jgi:P4 family phage/plasmid primase-like protien
MNKAMIYPIKKNPQAVKIKSFFKKLLDDTEYQIELRAFDSNSVPVDRLWTRDYNEVKAFRKNHKGKHHVYFGTVTREDGGGKKEDCREVPWLWADIDFKDFDGGEQEALTKLNSFEHEPSVVVKSGGGLHCYWLLKDVVDAQCRLKDVERALKAISGAISADKSRTDITSLLRVPGSIIVKPEYEEAKCFIKTIDLDKTISLDEILADIPEHIQVEDWKNTSLVDLKKAIVQGNRDAGTFDYIRAYVLKYQSSVDTKKLEKIACKLLDKAGGDDVDQIKEKVSGWIQKSIKKLSKAKKYTPLELANLISDRYDGYIIYVNEEFRVYRDGYWQHVTDQIFRKRIAKADAPNTSAPRTSNVLTNLKDLNSIPDAIPKRNLICLLNGVLNPKTGKLKPHSPKPRMFNQLPIKWDPEAKCPLWKKTLKQIFKGDKDAKQKIRVLQMFFGYCLIRDTSQAKFLWLVGPGGNGKSLILDILSSILGPENLSRVMLNRLNREFVRAQLLHKLVNISPEMGSEDTIMDGYLKAIVSGDPIEAEFKFKPSFNFKPYARIIASTNELPRLLDLSEGFQRRAIILTFNRIFKEKEQDKNLVKKLQKELSGILLWAVQGFQKLRENGSFKIPASSKKALEDYRKDSNPVQQFVDDRLVAVEEGNLTTSDIYFEYDKWAKDRGYKRMNLNTFGKRLTKLGHQKRNSKGRSVWNLDWLAPLDTDDTYNYRDIEEDDDEL